MQLFEIKNLSLLNMRISFWAFSQTLTNISFQLSVLKATKKWLKVWNFTSFSAGSTDFKNVFLEKNHWAPSEVVEVKKSFSRSLRPTSGFHLVLTSFHLEFSLFWGFRLFDLGDLSDLRNSTRKYFENSHKSMHLFQRLIGAMNCT